MSYLSRIDHAFSDAPVLPLSENGRYVLFSDCHRGIGTSNDNFLKNQHLYFAALNYYYQHSFCYIELGDGDELWENRSFSAIQKIHSNVFWLLSLFYEEQRLFMLFWKSRYCQEGFSSVFGLLLSRGSSFERLCHRTGTVSDTRTPGGFF